LYLPIFPAFAQALYPRKQNPGSCGVVAILEVIVKFANQELCYTPPEPSLAPLKAGFGLRQGSCSMENFELAELVFDSAAQGNTAGVRASAAIARQLLYKAGSVCIDMHMQPKPGSDSVVLIGQLLDSKRPDQGIKDTPVRLLCDGDTISHQKTNHVGEFEFGIEPLNHLQLAFGIAGRKTVIVPVPDTKTASIS
jgi:hypothetical protein